MSVSYDFTGQVALVTGAASGMGLATARGFAHSGASVTLADLGGEALEKAVEEIRAAGGKATGVACDVTDEADVAAMVERTVAEFGRLDAAFNNAGIEQPLTPLHEIADGDWERLIDVDLGGVFHCMKQQVPHMLRNGGGVIVNTSSGAGVKGIAGQSAYCAVKWGLIGLTKAAALDYARDGVRVNAICPGFVDTPMMERFTGGTAEGRAKVVESEPVGRPASAEEIAAAVLWLCSDDAAFVVGHALVMDGGQTV